MDEHCIHGKVIAKCPTCELVAYVLDEPEEAAREIERLRKVQEIALRVASSRRNGIVTDKAVLDLLDNVLESPEN